MMGQATLRELAHGDDARRERRTNLGDACVDVVKRRIGHACPKVALTPVMEG